MFEDSLMESGGRIRTNQKWTGLISTIVQLALVGFLVLLPLIFTEALPKGQLTTWLVAPPPPPPPPPPAAPQIQHVQKVSEIVDGALRTPSKIPKKIQMIKEEESPAPNTGVTGGVVGGVPGGSSGGVIGGIINSTSHLNVAPKFIPATPQRVRISQGVTKGLLIHRVELNLRVQSPYLALDLLQQGMAPIHPHLGNVNVHGKFQSPVVRLGGVGVNGGVDRLCA